MLMEIGSVSRVPGYIKRVKGGEHKLMGFGYRICKNYDPRARIINRIADEVLEVMGRNPLIDIAFECGRMALEDDYFISRKLYPNVDFYAGLIYQPMSFPVTMFRCCSPFRGRRGGSPNGKRCCSTGSRKSRARGRCIWGTTGASTSPIESRAWQQPPGEDYGFSSRYSDKFALTNRN
jgi:hypothetical protein